MCGSGSLSAFIEIDEVVHGALRVHSLFGEIKTEEQELKHRKGKASRGSKNQLSRSPRTFQKGVHVGGAACLFSSGVDGNVLFSDMDVFEMGASAIKDLMLGISITIKSYLHHRVPTNS